MIEGAQFHHLGIAVNLIAETAAIYKDSGYTVTETVFDPVQNVNIAFLERADTPLLELVEPVDRTSPVFNILKKVGVSAYHFCFEIDDLQRGIAELESRDFKLVLEPTPAIVFKNRKVCFLYHLHTGLIELLERAFPCMS